MIFFKFSAKWSLLSHTVQFIMLNKFTINRKQAQQHFNETHLKFCKSVLTFHFQLGYWWIYKGLSIE